MNCPGEGREPTPRDCGRVFDSFSGGEFNCVSLLVIMRARGLKLWRTGLGCISVYITIIKKLWPVFPTWLEGYFLSEISIVTIAQLSIQVLSWKVNSSKNSWRWTCSSLGKEIWREKDQTPLMDLSWWTVWEWDTSSSDDERKQFSPFCRCALAHITSSGRDSSGYSKSSTSGDKEQVPIGRLGKLGVSATAATTICKQ